MTIFVEDKLKPGVIDTKLADAVDIETTGSATDVQDALDILLTTTNTINATLAQAASAGIAWNFDNQITADPPLNSFRFNNADPEQATEIFVDVFSVSGRFDEFLTQFASGGFIYLQDRTSTRNNFLYQTTGVITLSGGVNGYYTIPVTFERSQSTLSAANGDTFTFIFLPVGSTEGGGGGGTLPNMFLNEISETDTPVYNRKIDTEAIVRFWLRAAQVQPAGINDPGTGLVIAEANGDLPEGGDTFQSGSNDTNVYVYLTLDDGFVTDLTTVWLVVTRDQGEADESLPYIVNVGTSFTERADLSALAAGSVYESATGFDGNGPLIHYRANDIIELYFQDTERFFTISEANAPNVDLTRAVKTLAENQTDADFQAKLNFQHGIPSDDQFKLDQLVEVSSTSTAAVITGSDTIYYKNGSFSGDSTDYFTTDFDTGLPPNLGTSAQTWLVAVPHQYNITGAEGIETGIATATEIRQDLLIDGATGTFNIYTIPLPTTLSGTNFFQLVGTTTTITEIDPSSLIKIDRNNVQADFLSHIENTQGNTVDSQRLAALENKVSTLYPLAPDVDALREWGDIYVPENPVQEVQLTTGYDLFADYRGPSTRFESAGVTYDDTGSNVVTYTGLSESLQRVFGFKVNAPANQVLLWVIDGSDRIPLIDMTSDGNYRVNNYREAETIGQPVSTTTFLSPGGGTDGIITDSQAAIFIIPDFPTGATNATRLLQVGFDVLLNGSDTGAEHIQAINIPDTNDVQDRIDVTVDIPLGPLNANRIVTVTIGYRFALPTPDEYRIVLSLRSAPSDVTIRAADVALTRSYTSPTTVVRTDDFQVLQDGAGDYTFTGENEILFAFHPFISNGTMDVVPAAITSTGTITELNNRLTSIPNAGLEDVEIPDTTALAGFEFRTFRVNHILIHSDLSTLLGDRTIQWDYGLARLRTVSTTHAVTEAIDLASGSTIDGQSLTTARTVQKAQTFTPASAVNVSLPTSTTLSDFIFMEVTWHTGVGTATDNNNRNYTELGLIDALVEASDNEVILGGRGRGADNYGIEVDTATISGADTSIDMGIINLNDVGGATLPTGSLITEVRFY